MERKDIYEHLAHIYLDTPARKKVIPQPKVSPNKLLLIINIAGISLVIALISINLYKKNQNLITNTTLLQQDLVKLSFDFEPAKKQSYSINLNKMDLSASKSLGFALKKSDPKNSVSLKIEFTNSFREKSEIYIRDIQTKWKTYAISLFEFKNISDWSNMRELAFIIEEWNSTEKGGALYLDNVSLMK